jgi:hypothetical protein
VAGLTARHLQAIHTLLRNRHGSAPLNATWQRIHELLEVGEPRGNRLHFDERMLRILRHEAERESGAANLLAGVPDADRLQAARDGLRDEKLAPQRPDDGFVLVKGALPAPLPTLPAQTSLRVPLAHLAGAAIERLVVIENLDSFDCWEQYSIPAELGDALVLYRGHGGLARGARRLLGALATRTQVTMFGDYDPAGLAIAASLPNVDAVLVPLPGDSLLRSGNRQHFLLQHRATRFLDNSELGGWQSLWSEMRGHGLSIKQQHMLALKSELRLVRRLG